MPRYLAGDMKPLSEQTKKWKIFHEESADLNLREERPDFEELRGYHDTRIYVWGMMGGELTCCVSTENNHVYNRLSRIPGLKKYSGCVLLFPAMLLDIVAEEIKAKKRRILSPEQRERNIERLKAYGFPQKKGTLAA